MQPSISKVWTRVFVKNATLGEMDVPADGQEANLVAAQPKNPSPCIFVPKLTTTGELTYKWDGER